MAGNVPVAYVERAERPFDGRWADQQVTGSFPVDFAPADAPLPPNETRAWPIGRTSDRAWSHVQRFITLNIQAINSIQAPHFLVPKIVPGQRALGSFGKQRPIVAPILIEAPPTGSYGGAVSVTAPPNLVYALDPVYRKLL